jgi:D-aminopeptidase
MEITHFDEAKIRGIFAELNQCGLPGGAIGIAIGGKPVYRQGFGLANMELPLVVSPMTRMRIGSTSKHFACFAYLLLCEEGKAGIDDPIGAHLPDLHPITHNVTMRQLMGNIGGLRDAFDISWVFSGIGRRVSSAELLALYRRIDDANTPPGTAWIYNNGGFLILGAAIERITGRSLAEVLRERIFNPTGMHDTLLRHFDTDFVANSATLHTKSRAGEFEKLHLGTEHGGEGGIVSTVDDMLRWLAHMDEPVIGTAATWDAMKAPLVLANGSSTGYGLGLITDRYRGIETLSHSGAVMGGNSHMLKVPAAQLDVAIMLNRDDVSGLVFVNKILDACLTGLDSDTRSTGGAPIIGSYRSSKTGRVVQLFVKEGQQVASIDGFDLPVALDEEGVLSPLELFSSLKQTVRLIGEAERPSSIEFSDFGNVDELLLLPSVIEPDVRAIAGIYRLEAAGAEVTIADNDGGPQLVTRGQCGSNTYDLECLSEGVWRAKHLTSWPWGGVLSFDSTRSLFRFSNPRTWALIFHRVNGVSTSSRWQTPI